MVDPVWLWQLCCKASQHRAGISLGACGLEHASVASLMICKEGSKEPQLWACGPSLMHSL